MQRLATTLLLLLLVAPAARTAPPAAALVQDLRAATTPAARDQALRNLARASDAGSGPAAEALAKVHGKGLFGVPRDTTRARDYLERAATLGSPAARRYLLRHTGAVPPLVAPGASRAAAPARLEATEFVMLSPTPPAIPDESPLADLTRTRKLQVFTSPTCPPCRAFEPVVQAFCATRADLDLEFIDVSTDAGRGAANRQDVEATPTTLFRDSRDEVLTRILGFRSNEELEGLLGKPAS